MASVRPMVSIGLPVYNGARYLRQALESLLEQDYADCEIIISDNASTDETPAICQEFVARDARISYHRAATNQGCAWNFNRVFELSQGKYFMWGAHDDLWHPSFVSRCVERLESSPEDVICYSWIELIDSLGQPNGDPYVGWTNEEPTPEARWKKALSLWSLSAAIYGLMRRETAARTRLTLPMNSSDYIFVAEMSLHGKVHQIPELLQKKRVPDPGKRYHSRKELNLYMGGAGRGIRFLRWLVATELVNGLRHAGLPRAVERDLARETRLAYFTHKYWLIDVKEYVQELVGTRPSQVMKRALRPFPARNGAHPTSMDREVAH